MSDEQANQVGDANALVSFDTNAISLLVSNREDISREDRRSQRDFYVDLLGRRSEWRGEETDLFAVTYFVLAELRVANWWSQPRVKLEELLKRVKVLEDPTDALFLPYGKAFKIAKSLGFSKIGQTDLWIIAQTAHEKLPIATSDRQVARIARQMGIETHAPLKNIEQNWAQDQKTLKTQVP